MATATRQRQSTQEIFSAIELLDINEVEKLIRRVLQMQARRRTPMLSARESELLEQIYQEKRPGFQMRFDELTTKRREFTLTPEEYAELLELTNESECFTVRRLEALVELAQLRRLTLPVLMKRLGLKTPPFV